MKETIRLYCICGDGFYANGTGDLASHAAELWEMVHRGESHERCDAKTANRARQKAIRKLRRTPPDAPEGR